MIPKVIHYIWLGGNPTPKIFDKCLTSWKKFCPDWEIKRWDESNVNIDCCKYCRKAYDAKKFAFASDVLRFDILSKEGGVYLDIDVELVRSIDELLKYKLVSGFENDKFIAPGLFLGVEPHSSLIIELLESYNQREFQVTQGMKNQETICAIFSDKLKNNGFQINNVTQEIDGIKIFSSEYFAPKSMSDGSIKITKMTYSIHHYASSWVPLNVRIKTRLMQLIKRTLGEKIINKIKSKKKNLQGQQNITNKKKKVLHILSSNKYSGAENVACQIIKALGEDCESAYCSPDGQIREALKDRNIKFIPLRKMSKKEIRKAVKEFKPDIIHAHDPRAICNVGRIKGNFKLIAHMHSNRPDFKKKSINSIIFNFIVKKKRINHIFWVSESCLNEYIFKKKIKNKSTILNNIINQQEIIKKSETAELQDLSDIVFLGRLTYPKNPQRLMYIISKIKEKKPDIKVSIIGDGDLMQETKALAKDLKLDNSVTFYGFLTNAFGILKNSKLFLMSSRFEGNPMCVLEAQTLGLPVIAPQISELKTTIKNDISGYLYETDDECVNFLLEHLDNRQKYEELRKSTDCFSRNYNNVENYRKEILDIYKKV